VAEPGLPFSLVFRAEPGAEDRILKVASAYEAASKRRVPPPAYPALRKSSNVRGQRSIDQLVFNTYGRSQ
jgi:hypothetical protein